MQQTVPVIVAAHPTVKVARMQAGGTAADAAGFGLIEIVVSMFLPGILAIAFLPLLVQFLRVSVVNAAIATSIQLVSEQIEQARAQGTVCSALPVSATTTSSLDSTLTAYRVRGACPPAAAVSTGDLRPSSRSSTGVCSRWR